MDELLSEFALAHVEGSKTVASYARDDLLLEMRRPVMHAWSNFLKVPTINAKEGSCTRPNTREPTRTEIVNKRSFVESLALDNQRFYDTPDGRGMLKLLDLAFEHSWIYLFEIVQNAIDAGARQISIQLADDRDGLVFQHDGAKALGQPEVEGLSKLFRSTKGAASVGFMGIGFKSVFGRFLEARVSGWDWKFSYEIREVKGETYGDVQIDPLGAVVPQWDDRIGVPDGDFTTRFELRRRREGEPLKADIDRFLPAEDRTLLAILAECGVRRLEVGNTTWTLAVKDEDKGGGATATARCAHETLQWRLFSVRFQPSTRAVANFLEHRQLQPSAEERHEVYREAARPRRVLGVLRLNEEGVPAPPKRGRIYATLPTGTSIPFGLHVNADWLLNISRTGLGEIEDNAWQREIMDRIADLLAAFLGWVSATLKDQDSARVAYSVLASPAADGEGLERMMATPRWRKRLREHLAGVAVVPVWTRKRGRIAYARPAGTIVPPPPLGRAFEEEPGLMPRTLMSGPVLAQRVFGRGGLSLMTSIGLVTETSLQELEETWAGGLEYWWSKLQGKDTRRRDLLFRLWSAVSETVKENGWATAQLPCVRTMNGTWHSVDESAYFNEALPSAQEPGGSEMRVLMEPFIAESECISEGWLQELRRAATRGTQTADRSNAREFIEKRARGIALTELVEKVARRLDELEEVVPARLLAMGWWAMGRRRRELLVRVLAERGGDLCNVPTADALLSGPYVQNQQRERLFPTMPVISGAYLEGSAVTDPAQWRVFFEDAGAKGGVDVLTVDRGRADSWQTRTVGDFLGRSLGSEEGSNSAGYRLQDFDIPELPGPSASKEVRAGVWAWLEEGFRALREWGNGKPPTSIAVRGSREEKLPAVGLRG